MTLKPFDQLPFSMALLDNLSFAMMLVDANVQILYANAAAQALLLTYSETDLQSLRSEIGSVLQLCGTQGGVYKNKVVSSFGQSYRYYELSVSIFAMPEFYYLLVLRDITPACIAEQFLFSRVNRLARMANLAQVAEGVASTATLLRFLANYLQEAFSLLGCAFLTLEGDQGKRVCVASGLDDADLQAVCTLAETLYARLEQADQRLCANAKALIPGLHFDPNVYLVAWRLGTAYRVSALALVFVSHERTTPVELEKLWRAVNEMSAPVAQALFLDRLEQAMRQRIDDLERINADLRRQMSEREQVEQKLLAQRNFNAIILDTMDALVIVLDRQGRIVRVNRAFERFLGYSSAEMVNKRIWQFLAQSQDAQNVSDVLANIQVGLSPFQYANRWKTRNGQERTIAWSSSMLKDATQEAEYIVAIGIDITDQKNVEKLLERERILLRRLIDSIPDMIFYKDPQGVYLGWNAAFEAQMPKVINLGLGPYSDRDIYPPELAEKFYQSDQQVLSSGQPLIYEDWTVTTDGQLALFETHKTPYYGVDGELIGVIGVARDITRHRMAEDALRKANREIEQLIASLSSLLVVVSPDLRVQRWNPTAENVLGVKAEQTIGCLLTELSPVLDWTLLAEATQRCCDNRASVYLDPVRFKRTDGTEGVLGMSISLMIGAEDQHLGYIILGADITERQILETRLEQARKMESIGQLSAGIAHEINTPIQYIGDNVHFLKQSFADLLQAVAAYQQFVARFEGQADAQDALQTLNKALQRLDLDYLASEIPSAVDQTLEGIQRVSEIVRAMKGFAHSGERRMTPVNLNKALQDTLTVTRNEWKYVAEVETEWAADLPNVLCAAGEINQVFLNLIMNAVDAIRDVVGSDGRQKGKIRLSTHNLGNWVEVRIADTGTGIPEAVRSRIFEPFFTTKEVGKGTGQGLAIAYDIVVTKHKGDLTFETQIGQGTTFIVRLPVNTVVE
jgi:PAS domain S-box-containing protein